MNRILDESQLDALRDLMAALDDLGIPAVIIGGVAVSLIAKPRYTNDLDALIVFDTADLESLAKGLERHGLPAAFPDMIEFARRMRLAMLRHAGTGIIVDIALGCMPFEEETLRRAQTFREEGIEIRLPSPEDLVILKAIANRPKDQEDIRNISAAYPGLDRKRIRKWVEQYAEVLEAPGLWKEIEALLGPAPKKKPKSERGKES